VPLRFFSSFWRASAARVPPEVEARGMCPSWGGNDVLVFRRKKILARGRELLPGDIEEGGVGDRLLAYEGY